MSVLDLLFVFVWSQAPLVPGHAGMKFTVLETLDHIKEEFQLFQAQYHR